MSSIGVLAFILLGRSGGLEIAGDPQSASREFLNNSNIDFVINGLTKMTPQECMVALGKTPSCLSAVAKVTAMRLTKPPLATYSDSFAKYLRQYPFQQLLAGVAVVIGACCSWDGPGLWRILFTVSVALLASGVVLFESSQAGLVKGQGGQLTVGLEAFATVLLAMYFGFEGAQVLFGVTLGFFGAYVAGDWARQTDDTVAGFEIVWYSAGAMLGLVLMTGWRDAMLATVAPLLGGLLISSSCGLFASRACGAKCGLWVPPADSVWLDTVSDLLHGNSVSLAAHVVCAIVGSVAYLACASRLLAMGCLLLGILVSALVAAFGLPCDHACPPWMHPAVHWQWPVIGSAIWALVTAAAAWRQLGRLTNEQSQSLSTFVKNQFHSGQGREPSYHTVSPDNLQASAAGSSTYSPVRRGGW